MRIMHNIGLACQPVSWQSFQSGLPEKNIVSQFQQAPTDNMGIIAKVTFQSLVLVMGFNF